MSVHQLGRAAAAERRAQPLTYDGVGGTRGTPPPGFVSFTRTRRVHGSTDFDSAVEALMSWQVHSRAGLRVAASDMRIVEGAVCVMTVGWASFALTIPCRVVYTVAANDECGFAYGTLPGHPESGEESFVLRRRSDGGLDFTVTAFSRPATWPARWGGPVTRAVQRAMTGRYLKTLDS